MTDRTAHYIALFWDPSRARGNASPSPHEHTSGRTDVMPRSAHIEEVPIVSGSMSWSFDLLTA